MSLVNQREQEHEHVFMLLPWWVNRSLDRDEQLRVQQHVDHCDACQQEVELLTSLQRSARTDASSATASARSAEDQLESDLARVMSRVAQEEARPHSAWTLPAWLRSLVEMGESFGQPRLAATAMAGVLALLLGWQFWPTTPTAKYQVLSSEEARSSSMQLAVRFSGSLGAADARQVLLAETDGVEGVELRQARGDQGEFVLVFPETVDVGEFSDTMNRLQGRRGVEAVEVVVGER